MSCAQKASFSFASLKVSVPDKRKPLLRLYACVTCQLFQCAQLTTPVSYPYYLLECMCNKGYGNLVCTFVASLHCAQPSFIALSQWRIQDFADGGAKVNKICACVSVHENFALHPLIECATPLWG